MRLWILAYVAAVLVVGVAGAAAAAAATAGLFWPGDGFLVVAATHMALAVLTYPLGVLAEAVFLVPFYLGIATPEEALVLATPFFALLGYLQWFRLIPAFYRGRA